MPSGKLRKALRAAGHHLDPVVQIGKEGMTEALLRQLDAQLLAHELVKVKVGTESPEDRFEVADRLAGEAGAQVAQVLGRTVLVYRRHPEKPRFEPRAASAAAERASPAPRRTSRRPSRASAPRPRRGPARGGRR
jgi:RNA-binding protein